MEIEFKFEVLTLFEM